MGEKQLGSGDRETDERAARGLPPDCVGWKAIGDALGISERWAREWERKFNLPVVYWGARAAGYADRLRACAVRRRAAA